MAWLGSVRSGTLAKFTSSYEKLILAKKMKKSV